MSTNKSANLNLHLWEPGDDFLRTEFNENFQKVDELAGILLTPTGVPSQTGIFTFSGSAENGTALVTFGFTPRFLLFEFNNATYLMTSGRSRQVYVGSSNYSVTFRLLGSSFLLQNNDKRITTSYTGYFAAFP